MSDKNVKEILQKITIMHRSLFLILSLLLHKFHLKNLI
jgi:preprotein translocase subunit SecG